MYTHGVCGIAALLQYIHSMLRADVVFTSNSPQLPRGRFAMRRTACIRISLKKIEGPCISVERMTEDQEQRQNSEKEKLY